MKAVVLHEFGGIDQLRYEDIPTPQPGPDEVLVQVAATSINPVDWKIRSGAAKDHIPVELPYILGRDVAGTVTRMGQNVRHLEIGQRVMGLVKHSYAEYLVAPAADLTAIPQGLEYEDSGALPLVVTTGGQLIQHMGPRPGDVILVTGALGGVGRTAVVAAKSRGAKVLAGVRAKQREEAAALQADQVVAIDDDDEISRLPELDGIADTVDHETIEKLIPKIKQGGVLGSVLGKPKGAEGKNIRVEAFMAKPDASLLRQMADAVRDGKLVIPIARRMKLQEAPEAQGLAEKGSVNGKILLTT